MKNEVSVTSLKGENVQVYQ